MVICMLLIDMRVAARALKSICLCMPGGRLCVCVCVRVCAYNLAASISCARACVRVCLCYWHMLQTVFSYVIPKKYAATTQIATTFNFKAVSNVSMTQLMSLAMLCTHLHVIVIQGHLLFLSNRTLMRLLVTI